MKKAIGLFFSLSGFHRKVERHELVVRKYSPNGGSLAGVAGRQLSINTGRVLADRRGRGSTLARDPHVQLVVREGFA